jgi:hypothetical protein
MPLSENPLSQLNTIDIFALKINIPGYESEPEENKMLVLQTSTRMIKLSREHENVSIYNNNDSETRIQLVEFIFMLKKLTLNPNYRIVVEINRNGTREYRPIIINTTNLLIDFYHQLMGEDVEVEHDYNDSDKEILLASTTWNMITLKQYQSNKNNRLDVPELPQRPDTLHRRIGGAFFPFINMSDINLSRFGMYKSVCTENYVDKCFIQSLIASGLFSQLEIDLMENMINVEKFPRMKI